MINNEILNRSWTYVTVAILETVAHVCLAEMSGGLLRQAPL